MKFIVQLSVFSLIFIDIYSSQHIYNRFRINRHYELSKIASQEKPSTNVLENENPVLTAENNKTSSQNDELITNRTLVRNSRADYENKYRFSLSSHNPTSKVISLLIDENNKESIVFFSTYISYRDTQG